MSLGQSVATDISITSSWSWVELGAVQDLVSTSPLPKMLLDLLTIDLSAINGAAELSFVLSRRDGSQHLTPFGAEASTQAWTVNLLAATTASAVWRLELVGVVLEDDDGLWLGLKLDAGTATGQARLTWRPA